MAEMISEEKASVSRRSALKLVGGAAVLAAGAAVLAACGSGGAGNTGGGATSGSSSAGGGTTSSSAAGGTGGGTGSSSGGFKVTGGTGKTLVKVAGNKATLTMRGDDIWNSADTFTYFDAAAPSGAQTWVVKVDSLDSTNEWAKGGIMARKSLDPGSAHVFLCVTDKHGVTLQHRDQDGTSEQGNDTLGDGTQTAPVWLKLSTDGKGNWTGYYSTDGKDWSTTAPASTNPIDLGSKFLVGLATTSHDATQHGNCVFEGWQGPALGSADSVGTNDTAQ